MVKHEHLIAQHGEAIEILGAFLMGDGGDLSKTCNRATMRFERDGHPVAEATLHGVLTVRRNQVAAADGARGQSPLLASRLAGVEDAFAEQHQPQRQERVGKRRGCDSRNATSIKRGS